MRFIEGPLYPIRLRFISQKLMKKKAGKPCYGLFNSLENCIYVATDQTQEQALHTLLHELMHASETQLEILDDEAKADIMATWMVRFFKLKNIERLLK